MVVLLPPPSAPPPSRPLRSVGKFLRDLLIATGILGVPLIALALFFSIGAAAIFLLMSPLYFVVRGLAYAYLAAPVALIVWGIAARRPGLVVLPLVFVLLAILSPFALRMSGEPRIAHYVTASLKEPSPSPAIIGLNGTQWICGETCQRRVIATSPFALAYGSPAGGWYVYRRAEGDVCFDAANLKSMLEYLADGYKAVCALASRQASIDDAVIFRQQIIGPRTRLTGDDAALGRLGGEVLEVTEQYGGRTTVLGRHVTGTFGSWLPLAGVFEVLGWWPKSPTVDEGPKIEFKSILAGMLRISERELDAPNQAVAVATLLDSVEPFLDKPEIAGKAADAWSRIAQARGRGHGDDLRPRLERFLASDDLLRIRAALDAVTSLPVTEQGFAQPRTIELAFSPYVRDPNGPVTAPVQWRLQNCHGPFDPATRERAKTRITTDGELSPSQRQIMFTLLICGDDKTRGEAVDTVLSLHGTAFEDTVHVIDGLHSEVWGNIRPSFWTKAEVDRLIERLPEIPTERLPTYLNSFRSGNFVTPEQKAVMIAEVQKRLDVVESTKPINQPEVRVLQQLIRYIPKNMF